jgi:hypothetical protein
MNTNMNSIKSGLDEIGACFATSTSKFICANHNCCQPLDGDKSAYHIHPDSSNPRQDDIKRFESLAELASWIEMCKAARAAPSQEAAHEIYAEWNATH